jgi:hypothetical protein
VDNVLSIIPTGADAVVEELQERAVDLWRQYLPGERPFILLLTGLENAHANFLSRALQFQRRVNDIIRTRHQERAVHPEQDPEARRRLLEFLSGYWSSPPESGEPPEAHFPVEHSWIASTTVVYNWPHDQQLAELARRVWSTRVALIDALNALRAALGVEPSPHHA